MIGQWSYSEAMAYRNTGAAAVYGGSAGEFGCVAGVTPYNVVATH